MNRNIRTTLFVALLATACQKAEDTPINSGESICLRAEIETTTVVQSKVSNTFPNQGKIAVIAAYCDAAGTLTSDWNNRHIDNQMATENNSLFTWETPQYWPFNGDNLCFLAYSPKATSNLGDPLTLSATTLTMTLPADNSKMPDILYSDSKPVANKATPNVDLGQLKHALSQVQLKIMTQDIGEPIQLKTLSLTTKKQAEFDLSSPATLLAKGNGIMAYTLVKTTTDLQKNHTYSYAPLLVFPDVSGADTKIHIRLGYALGGATTDVAIDYSVSDFLTNTTPAKLERAKCSILILTIQGQQITSLSGEVTPWNPVKDYEVTIE
ncbi:MAG: fimbrillin family protein [Odoribacter sp.]